MNFTVANPIIYFAQAKKPALGFVISFSVKSFQFSVDTFGCASMILS